MICTRAFPSYRWWIFEMMAYNGVYLSCRWWIYDMIYTRTGPFHSLSWSMKNQELRLILIWWHILRHSSLFDDIVWFILQYGHLRWFSLKSSHSIGSFTLWHIHLSEGDQIHSLCRSTWLVIWLLLVGFMLPFLHTRAWLYQRTSFHIGI